MWRPPAPSRALRGGRRNGFLKNARNPIHIKDMASQMWSTMRKRGGKFLENLNHTVEGTASEFFELDDGFLEGSCRGEANNQIGPEEGYKAALIQFQLDQVKLTKEYQKVIGEKEAELRRVRELYKTETGKDLDGDDQGADPVVDNADTSVSSLIGVGTDSGGRNPMAAFANMSADQLRAQVEVLLDSVTSWESRVAELVESKADYAAQVARMRLQVERSDLRMGDLVDRVKLQQSEMEKYILMAEEGRARTVKDRETIEGLVRDYTALVAESQAQERQQASAIEDLETKRDELVVKLKAYERNIIHLIDSQAEAGLKHQDGGAAKADSHAETSAVDSTATMTATVDALQKEIKAKEEKIKQLLASPAASAPHTAHPPDTALLERAQVAEAEAERLRKELERAKQSLEQVTKAGEKVSSDYAALRARRDEEERAEAALREEVTELQAKLEASYKGGKAEIAALQDRLVKMEGAMVREVEGARVQAREEAKQTYQRLVEVANQEKEQALELYAQENRKRKAVHNKLLELQGNIRVLCRVRPMLAVEKASGEGGAKEVTEYPSPEDLLVTREDKGSRNKMAFEFDRVFAPGSSQAEVFEAVAPIVTSVMDGYSACIFAYGQTGSGKTHTMEGPSEDRGVNFRALEEMFRLRQDRQADMCYTLSLSMLEVYNETIRDLLAAKGKGGGAEMAKLEVRMSDNGSYDVPGLTLVEVHSLDEVWQFMTAGKQSRAVGAHDMNEHSSRSHCIVSLRVRGENLHDKSLATVSKLHLIDLAGSERLSKTDATGDRLKEAQNINKSLSALGDVINALGSKNKAHIPYRNSKLTFLLQDSLGGNSKVLMFVNISPASYNVSETVCSLQFAGRCRAVALGVAKKGVADNGAGLVEGGEREPLQDEEQIGKARGGRGGIARPRSTSPKALTSSPGAVGMGNRTSPSRSTQNSSLSR